MPKSTDKYNSIMSEFKEKIQDEELYSFVKSKVDELLTLYTVNSNENNDKKDVVIRKLEERQLALEEKVALIENILHEIEEDIYEENCDDCEHDCNFDELDGMFSDCFGEASHQIDLEVLCPYCKHKISVDLNAGEDYEIECPECKHIIELKWQGLDDSYKMCDDCSGCKSSHQEIDLEDDEENNDDDDDDM